MIVITGATGKTGSKIAERLLEKGQKICLIGRTEEKLIPFRKKGAEIKVGDLTDQAFFTRALNHAEALYLLIPPNFSTDNVRAYYNKMGDIAVSSIISSGVKKVVFLSSLGAELGSGTGPVVGLHDVEQKLNILKDVDMVFLRPGYFMENILTNIPLMVQKHINGGTAKPDSQISMIATTDIAAKAAELLADRTFTGHTIVDLFGDIITSREATKIIGNAINSGELPYMHFSDQDSIASMKEMGLSENIASSFAEMSHAFDKGIVHATQIDPHTPNTQTRFVQFVNEVFKPAYQLARPTEVLAK